MKKRFLRWFFSLLFMLLAGNAFAQQINITGSVKDSNGDAIIGANVVVEGTNLGVVTDEKGGFTLSGVPSKGKLTVSYVGYEKQTVSISGKTSFRIVLREDEELLDDVVVVGYGTQRKSDVTGSVMQVKQEDLLAVTASDPLQALQGRVPGLAVMTNNEIGGSPTLRIRGAGSISANNDPLYVVDGFPLMNGSISEINANDIESIEVLKDASATAIYGSRGSNGVIMITTKKGSKGKKNLSFSANFGFQMPGRLPETMSHEQFVDFINSYYTFSRGYPVYTDENPAPNIHTDWQDEILRDCAPVQDYNITLEGSTGDTQYMLSGSVYLQDGLIPNTSFNKYTFHTNLEHKFNKYLTIGTHMQYGYTDKREALEAGLSGIWLYGWPTLPVYNEDGSYAVPADNPAIVGYFSDTTRWNPVANYNEITNRTAIGRLFGDVYAEVNILKGLKFRTNIGIDVADTRTYDYRTTEHTNSTGYGTGGNGYYKEMSRITENILSYENEINDHRFSITGVYSWQNYTYEGMSMSGTGFQNDATGAWDMELADRETVDYSSTKYENTLISFTGRGTYAFKDRYLLTASVRWDGSSRFGENNKWGFFPSVGLGWRISEESWLRDSKVLTNLKLRASYGVIGNQEIGNYESLPKLESANYIYNNTEIQGFYESIGNPDLKWERTRQFDVGFDLSFWNRLHITADYYYRRTSDLLYEVPIPSTSGFSTMLSNIGVVTNQGLEVDVMGRIVNKKDFKIDASFNISKNYNKINELYNGVESIDIYAGLGLSQYLKVGEPLFSLYALKSEGIIRTEEQLAEYQKIVPTASIGEEMYADIDGDGSISASDVVNIGQTEPNFYYGVSLAVEYKGFRLSVLGQGSGNFAAVGCYDSNLSTMGISGYGSGTTSFNYILVGENQTDNRPAMPTKYAYERMWSETNPDGIFPRAGSSNLHLSDRTNGGWHYFIVKSILLSYDFNKKLLRNVSAINGLNFFVNLQNFITFANHRGYNPENGDTSNPWVKSVTLGVNIKF